jgi:hypothetical protein
MLIHEVIKARINKLFNFLKVKAFKIEFYDENNSIDIHRQCKLLHESVCYFHF